MTTEILLIVAYFVATSLICAVLMAIDKSKAEAGERRTPESTLLFWAFLGGALGGKIAQKMVRHKTRKQPFATILSLLVVWNAVLFFVIANPTARTMLISFMLQPG